ncbi:hypothetical protein VTL71DRAFT_4618 [Oculimacula yallundae]|uniref:Calpain catalytic domain-containing protein n=1 Tax=Oculimacula yallundae TaxID=86028 RepID=A0ABR4C2J7_9HELO
MSSDSSDSSDSRPARLPPPPPPAKPKKKKKKYVSPQETITEIWSRFSVKKFSKATVILPFAAPPGQVTLDPSKPPQAARENLLVSEDFERAVQECRARVQKLVKECKRVNMRYRDPDFDIDWDLKMKRGHCLNNLKITKFNIRSITSSTSSGPKSVKRVHEIFDKPTFLADKVSPADVKQGSLGDCWLMASLTTLANVDAGVRRICVEYDTKIGIYGFVFHRDGEWIISIIDDKLYLRSPDWESVSLQRHFLEQIDREDNEFEYRKTYQTGSSSLFFAQCRDQNETWVPLLEKAYAKAHGDYAALQGGWIGEGLEDLTGGVTTELLTSDILDTDEFWKNEILKVNDEFLFGCSTGLVGGGYGNRDGITEGHAYVVMEAREISTGHRLVKLRNPWGKGKKGNWQGAWSDGSKEFTPEIQIELNHKSGSDSVFWISYQDLLRKYQHFDRTRLFTDCPDWCITQKWMSIDVPWKAEFEQKFRIVLKKESPIVMVLSQLDDRFFQGLKGQYKFRFQFRLHEVNSIDEHDYVVRSHGNYLMNRSVVTELKSLPAGTYAVFIMVVAERNTHRSSVEDVVKAQCKQKVDNEKLAQVGMSYNIAHSKGVAHSKAKDITQKALDMAKAREARQATRRKLWEERRVSRDVIRKQDKKNQEKKARKDAKVAAEQAVMEEDLPVDKSVQTDDMEEVIIEKEDKSVQTEESQVSVPMADQNSTSVSQEPEPEVQPSKDTDKAVQTEETCGTSVIDGSQGTADTPQSSTAAGSPIPMVRVPVPRPGPPPPPGRKDSRRHYTRGPPPPPPPPPPAMISEGESSDSPVSDNENLYSDDDDDPTLKPRPPPPTAAPGPKPKPGESDEEDEFDADPWNAVCVVGFRVYSKDEGLDLLIWDESLDEMARKVDETVAVKEDERGEEDVTGATDEAKGASEVGEEKEEKEEKSNDIGDVVEPKVVSGGEAETSDKGTEDEVVIDSEEGVSASGTKTAAEGQKIDQDAKPKVDSEEPN